MGAAGKVLQTPWKNLEHLRRADMRVGPILLRSQWLLCPQSPGLSPGQHTGAAAQQDWLLQAGGDGPRTRVTVQEGGYNLKVKFTEVSNVCGEWGKRGARMVPEYSLGAPGWMEWCGVQDSEKRVLRVTCILSSHMI